MSELRAVYRQLVKRLHPDRARNPEDAAARTELMQMVNALRDGGHLDGLQAMLKALEGQAPARKLRAVDVDPRTLRRAVLTEDGWVCPAR